MGRHGLPQIATGAKDKLKYRGGREAGACKQPALIERRNISAVRDQIKLSFSLVLRRPSHKGVQTVPGPLPLSDGAR